jgi:excisionase family DNA binding protein
MPLRPRGPILYTGQDVARFCEVDLKTVHHWADRGKIPHYRTEGRHLRFRRNDVVRFLRAHGYPLPDEVTTVRPTAFLTTELDEDAQKKLAARFVVQTFETAIAAIARLVADAPDAIITGWDDPTIIAAPAFVALKSDPATSFIMLVVLGDESVLSAARDAGADLVLQASEQSRLASELARALAVA